MNVETWLDGADRNLRSTEVMLQDGDPNSACTIAYYAIFYAAKAALLAANQGRAAAAKTHSGLIASFNQHLIQTGAIGREHSTNLGVEASRRLLAAYEGEMVSVQAAEVSITHATDFVAAVRSWANTQPG